MINKNDFVCLDFETVGESEDQAKNPYEAWPVSVACKAYNARTLEPYPNSEFYSLMTVDEPAKIHPSCLNFVKLTLKEVEEAPTPSAVWAQLTEFVNQFNPKRDSWGAPILAGQNIRNYDSVIIKRLNDKFNKGKVLFSDFRQIDLMDFTFAWFENSADPRNNKLITILEFCGIKYTEDKLHHALQDVRFTGEVLMKFLKLHRYLSPKVRWKGDTKQN